ncbi:class I adenylate-forming enzyme family protein [Halomonas saccharevitans]|uniref:Long-chain-fatty-acid--CoA ligase n=1 Tax=Halomonas saccharevitans TaxID=416872 RepID=A0A1I7CIR7_9GAMM|nr:class I adenylate-forming enzyme family protein [Halomonas saccharevitans]SFT99274.1 Acyl-CoA synthetase (AMP-forming)/AMP-acid ligase II [Halomonas saccharevitans]
MKLSDHLSEVSDGRVAISTPSASISYGEILRDAQKYYAFLSGKKVAFHSADIIGAAVLMTAIDGYGESLVLLQPGDDLGTTARLIEDSGVELVISDSCQDLKSIVEVPVFSKLEEAFEACSNDAPSVLEEVDTRWVVSTSGTTGKPKLVCHSLRSLTRTSRSNKEKGEGQVWGLLYGYSRFAGLQVVLQSLLVGAELVAPDSLGSLEEQLSMLLENGCTHLSATPTMWRKILMVPRSDELDLQQITLGGEISDDKILKSLKNKYPKSYVTHIYASTEAGVGFSVKDGKSGFPVEYLTNPPSGVELKVSDGRLWVKNEYVGERYIGDQQKISSHGWVDTGDNVDVTSDRVYFLGRDSGVINVGGNKVHPEVVEEALLSHPVVDMAKVYAKKNPIMGSLVVADIVVQCDNKGGKEVANEVKKFLADKLEPYMIPAIVRVVSSFDVNPAGKLVRK